ncbi:AAA family ATPase [Spirillospora sp. NPDC029432]|uniref:helix-turn-helix transcriptional regulator n=1 Tax=Spirillospora sp. NPDC029432 TaxID=3154599 RepID=UPI0034568AC5
MRLHGRDVEIARIDRLVRAARDGRGEALILRGEAGIGKTALLDRAAATAADEGMAVLRGAGIETESGLPYAGLHLLLRRHLDRIGALPDGQAGALRAALGMGAAGEAGGDRFLVGLAVLTLLADLAEERPLLCAVDDVQWLDRESAAALLFAVRRLEAEPLAVLLAERDQDPADPAGTAAEPAAHGLAELRLGGLGRDAAAGLLAERAAELPRYEINEVLAEAAGNPLALVELPALRSGGARAGSSRFARIQQGYAERVAALPEATRTLLLLVAADDAGDPGVILKAAEALGASVADLEPAERRGLLSAADGRLEFRHPLVRTAVTAGVSLNARLAAHRALADAYLDLGDPCHHAWHLAGSATGPDERVAAVLEGAAGSGGGSAAATAMLERAAELSPDPVRRGRRLAAAARAAADGGLPEKAVALAERAGSDLADPVERAELVLIRASLADEGDRGREAYRMLSATAETVAGTAPATAGYLFFKAASAAANAGDIGVLREIAGRAEGHDLPNAHLVRAMATMFIGQDPLAGDEAGDGAAALRALLAGRDECLGLRDMINAGWWQLLLGDIEGAHGTAEDLERRCRGEGAIGLLALVLPLLARTRLMLGRYGEALTAATEGMRIAGDTGRHRLRIYNATVLALLAAIQGDEARCAELAAEALRRGLPPSGAHAAGALSLLDLGLGRHEPALARLADVVAGPGRQGAIASLPDLVEAAVRSGTPEAGRDAAARFQDWAARIRRPWAEAIALRCAALLADDPAKPYERAVELHREGGASPFERARTELLYAEWLRRSRRRNDARPLLHSALEIFDRLGAAPWAERARSELRAAGESVAERGSAAGPAAALVAGLTPQELQVVRLAAAGLSNREIGAQLFLSPRTIGYHLYKAFPKLGVASRAELARLDLA